jgi:hypothetical protein
VDKAEDKLDGWTLYDVMRRTQKLEPFGKFLPHTVIGVTVQLLRDLILLHRGGVYHGNVFSFNVLLSGNWDHAKARIARHNEKRAPFTISAACTEECIALDHPTEDSDIQQLGFLLCGFAQVVTDASVQKSLETLRPYMEGESLFYPRPFIDVLLMMVGPSPPSAAALLAALEKQRYCHYFFFFLTEIV